jgi:hypothetical protein
MQDLPLILGRLIGIVVLTLHDYLHYRVNHLRRRQPQPLPRRRLAHAGGPARSRARPKRPLPYTGTTQRLNAGDARHSAPRQAGTPLDLSTLSPDDLWSAMLQRYDGDPHAAAKFLAAALSHGSHT